MLKVPKKFKGRDLKWFRVKMPGERMFERKSDHLKKREKKNLKKRTKGYKVCKNFFGFRIRQGDLALYERVETKV